MTTLCATWRAIDWRRRFRGRAVAGLLWFSPLAHAVVAQTSQTSPIARPPRREPPLVLSATQRTAVSIDPQRARHVAPLVKQWEVRADSIVGGVVFARMPGDVGIRYHVDGVLRLPVTQERLGVPVLTSVPSRIRGGTNIDPPSMLPLADADRAAQHETMLTASTFAAAFDGLPDGVGALHIADGAGPIALRLDATRRYRVIGDSTLNGRAVRVVRDSTNITYARRTLLPSRYTSVRAASFDSVRGTIVGTRLVDLGTRRTVLMHDTLQLYGRRRVADGYGGEADVPLYEYCTRDVTIRDSLSPPVVREPFDMVRSGGDRASSSRASIDSAVARLRVDPSIVLRDSIRRPFRFGQDSALSKRIIAASLAIGDTAAAVQFLVENAYAWPRAAITTAHYQWLRRLLQDPAAALRVGVDRELLVANVIDGLLHTPPALARDSAMCKPAACRAMAQDANLATNSLALRAVALVAAMVTTPRGWTDSVIANARTNPLLTGRALDFARGASSNAVASAKAAIPDAGASAAAWLYWLRGEDSSYMRIRASRPTPPAASRLRPRPIDVGDLGATAIRFAAKRTGQSYTDAFRANRTAAVDDSTRALFTALLIASGDSVFTTSELRALILGPPSEEQRLAVQRIAMNGMPNPRQPLPRAPDSIATLIGVRVIEWLYGGQSFTFVADANTNRGFFAPPTEVDSIPRFISMDSLPPAVRQRAAALGHPPMPVGWTFVSGTTGSTTYISAVHQSGPFFRVDVTHTTLYARSGTRSGGYASGSTLWFVEGPQGWVVFSASSWVT